MAGSSGDSRPRHRRPAQAGRAQAWSCAVVQQHDTGEVLMVGWMDDEALHRTLTTGRVDVLEPRSRQEYWRKGDTSGNVQRVKSVALDCDGDALLVRVDQVGAACHTGDAHLLRGRRRPRRGRSGPGDVRPCRNRWPGATRGPRCRRSVSWRPTAGRPGGPHGCSPTTLTPVGLYRTLAGGRPGTFILESAEATAPGRVGRSSGCARARPLSVRDGRPHWTGDVPVGHPAGRRPARGARGSAWRRCAPLLCPGLPPLTGGLVGALAGTSSATGSRRCRPGPRRARASRS